MGNGHMITALAHHWQLALAAGTLGLALGAVFVAVYYLAVPVRLHLARDPEVRARILRQELARLQRLGDAAAVSEEHVPLRKGSAARRKRQTGGQRERDHAAHPGPGDDGWVLPRDLPRLG